MYAKLVTCGAIQLMTPHCLSWGTIPLYGDCIHGFTPKVGLCLKGVTDH